MYEIPPNVTGFATEQIMDISKFKILCYSLQGFGLLKVVEVYEYRYPDNFYKAKVQDKEEKFYIYINYGTFVFGFSKVSDIYKLGGSFIDKPLLKEALKELDDKHSVVSANILNSEATKRNLGLLNEQEYRQVIYWYPDTIGEVLFSPCFD
ncbi:hypothetical protein [Myxosarcina sp. GI1]|uniref:hypothetical protein n=1 Tax=Myxosarcina sp. GI1 TaxID=1541065 RepID=UPI0005610E29|nr:hypothetical protein [Myxosarcina sp. GI1]